MKGSEFGFKALIEYKINLVPIYEYDLLFVELNLLGEVI